MITCKRCDQPLYRSGNDEYPWAHRDPYRLTCYRGEPWAIPELAEPKPPPATPNFDNVIEAFLSTREKWAEQTRKTEASA